MRFKEQIGFGNHRACPNKFQNRQGLRDATRNKPPKEIDPLDTECHPAFTARTRELTVCG